MNKIAKISLISLFLFSLFSFVILSFPVEAKDENNCIETANYKDCIVNEQRTLEVLPPRYYDSGQWKNVDMNLKENIFFGADYEITKATYSVEIENEPKVSVITIQKESDVFEVTIKGKFLFVDGNKIYYDISDENINATISYTFNPYEVEKLVTIYNLKKGSLTNVYEYSEDYSHLNFNNEIEVSEDLYYWDSSGKGRSYKQIEKNSSNIKLTIDKEFINSAIFPIYLDPDLYIGENTNMGGNVDSYDNVLIYANSTVTLNESFLNITASQSITIYGTIRGDSLASGGTGVGSDGVVVGNDGSGGGGAGHYGTGGAGGDDGQGQSGGSAGISYGDEKIETLNVGSQGGQADGYTGGRGGLAIGLKAPTIFINGTIAGYGEAGFNTGKGGTGGGSGGTLKIIGIDLTLNDSTLQFWGGNGGGGDDSDNDGGGGGGSGGRINVFYEDTYLNGSISTSVVGGTGGAGYGTGSNGANGDAGIYNMTQRDDLGLNSAPSIANTTTIPLTPSLTDTGVYLNLTAYDLDNDDITSVWFAVAKPNGTVVINSVNGTWQTGEAYQGENETWHSSTFDILESSGNLGTWSWNVTVESNGSSNQNGTDSGTFSITDTTNPEVSITSLTTNTTSYQNISIPIDFTNSDNVEVDSCWYTTDSGATNTTIASCNNFTFGILNSTYNITLYVNDTSNNINSSTISNFTIEYDTTNPELDIVSPSGSLTSRTISIDIDASDSGNLSYCYYNITRGASTDVSNTELTDCDTDSVAVSSDGDFVIHVHINDTTGNGNYSNSSFSVDTSGGDTGGGGGGTTIVREGEAGWIMEVAKGIARYDIEIPKGSSVKKDIKFENIGTSTRTITLTCRNIEGDICQYVTFPENPFTLPPVKDEQIRKQFVITLPEIVENGNYQFNIVGTDDNNIEGLVSVFLGVGTKGIIVSTLSKLGVSTEGGIPYIIIFLPLLVLLIVVFAKVIPKEVPAKALFVVLLGGSISLFVLYLL